MRHPAMIPATPRLSTLFRFCRLLFLIDMCVAEVEMEPVVEESTVDSSVLNETGMKVVVTTPEDVEVAAAGVAGEEEEASETTTGKIAEPIATEMTQTTARSKMNSGESNAPVTSTEDYRVVTEGPLQDQDTAALQAADTVVRFLHPRRRPQK